MDAFVKAIASRYMVFAKTAQGDTWRIWFDGNSLPDHPLMEKLTPDQLREYRDALEPLKETPEVSRASHYS